ncbi:MAG: DUF1800 domain-containing protein [Aquabacterium sp.]|uniref:DUF1800 domain-containing protein n=1 Tax=Aquabacterium sp. TaxID=1872578 RepID=UPI0025C07573|nr:DUF1800 domain-containing protein [Aquabacterium sp.]MBI5924576.1 DUF1800 domain-containing protein [Aquabacterium sp.]
MRGQTVIILIEFKPVGMGDQGMREYMIRMAHGLCLVMVGLLLSACGGGCPSCSASPTHADGSATSQAFIQAAATSGQGELSRQEATRFLTQASFGPTPEEVSHLMSVGIPAWLDEQFDMPLSTMSHVQAWDLSDHAIKQARPGQRASSGEVVGSFMRQALTSKDQLRQRVAFALSEIFVVSIKDSCGDNAYSRGVAGYLDMLGRHAFGSFRDLLASVSLNPVMGCYLSHMKNRGENASSGRVPDENYAREIMQLFSIGLYQLNKDGSLKTDAAGQPIETYGPADITGLAKVFTGWSWWCPQGLTPTCFSSDPSLPQQYVTDMRGYALYHSRSEKRFLGTVIGASLFSSPQSDLDVALDVLSAHPNVGPFIGKQLIQRLITSNPSPAYVQRVAQAFDRSGGSLRAMVRAVYLDPEARNLSALSSNSFGKVREPILRFTALARAIGVRSDSGMFLVTSLEDPGTSLGQSPMASSSVFNFFRPAYVMPGSRMARAGLLTPELQISTETSAAGYINFLTSFMWGGLGSSGYGGAGPRQDIQLLANADPQHPLSRLTDRPAELVEELNQLLMYGTMPQELAQELREAVTSVEFRVSSPPTTEQIARTRQHRLWTALLLTAASPEYQVQR